jgi:hypothetical protein
MTRRARVTAISLVPLLLWASTSCGGDEVSQSSSSAKVSATPKSDPSASCVNRADGGRGKNILTAVDLRRDSKALAVSFNMASKLPTSGTALLAVDAWSTDGESGYQLGVKYLDGAQIAHFVFDQVEASQVEVSDKVKISGTKLTAGFPLGELTGLGDSFKWSAVYNVRGDDVDNCPQPGRDTMNPKQSTFPQ